MNKIGIASVLIAIVAGILLRVFTMQQRESDPFDKTGSFPVVVEKPTVTPFPLTTPPASYTLPQGTFVSQSFNNCGPATLSMVLSMFGQSVSQDTLREEMRPFSNPYGGVDDKSIFAPEFVTYAKKHGMEALQRPGGDIELIKKLVANGIPVIVRTWLHPDEDIGHFRIVRGYSSAKQRIIQDDSYQGPGLEFSEEEFMSMWQPFNYGYILVYPPAKQDLVEAILGENIDERIAYKSALTKAERELNECHSRESGNPGAVWIPDQVGDDGRCAYAQFNIASSYYHLGDYKKSVEYFEKAESQLPSRMLWYQLEPIYAYAKLNNSDRVFRLTDDILHNGNLAYSELYQVRGQTYQKLGNTEAAKAEFEKAAYYNSSFKPAKDALARLGF